MISDNGGAHPSRGRYAVVVLAVLWYVIPSRGMQIAATVDPGADRWSVLTLLRYQSGLRKEMAARDVYKLLYQAAFGVEHLLTDTAGVRAYLDEELSRVENDPGSEPLLERISPDGRMLRVDLRHYKALHLSPDSLVRVMFASAAETIADTALFYTWWNEFASLVRYRLISPEPEGMAEWIRRVEQHELGPVHHSEAYVKNHRPAYRVVRRDVIIPMLHTLGIP
jgi:hypothetical protein